MNQRVLSTGSSFGIGAALAQLLRTKDVRVVLTTRSAVDDMILGAP